MSIDYKTQCVPTYHLLTPDQINSIHTATLELLETGGGDGYAGFCDFSGQWCTEPQCSIRKFETGMFDMIDARVNSVFNAGDTTAVSADGFAMGVGGLHRGRHIDRSVRGVTRMRARRTSPCGN